MEIKQLSQNGKIIFPQTASEAVLVKKDSTVITLDKALAYKLESVETPVGSGLNAYRQGTTVILTHSNQTIVSNNSPEPLLVQHDTRGHIIATKPAQKFIVAVNGQKIIESNGSEEKVLPFGDDFTVDNNNIQLKWININGDT